MRHDCETIEALISALDMISERLHLGQFIWGDTLWEADWQYDGTFTSMSDSLQGAAADLEQCGIDSAPVLWMLRNVPLTVDMIHAAQVALHKLMIVMPRERPEPTQEQWAEFSEFLNGTARPATESAERPELRAASTGAAFRFTKHGGAENQHYVFQFGDESGIASAGLKGARYVEVLLRRPGVAVAAKDLCEMLAAENRGGGENPDDCDDLKSLSNGSGGEDWESKEDREINLRNCNDRLREIDEELDELRRDDRASPAIDKLTEEREQILAEVKRLRGSHGKIRKPGGKRGSARVSVRQAIDRFIEKLTSTPRFAEHLTGSIQYVNSDVIYSPADPVPSWEIG